MMALEHVEYTAPATDINPQSYAQPVVAVSGYMPQPADEARAEALRETRPAVSIVPPQQISFIGQSSVLSLLGQLMTLFAPATRPESATDENEEAFQRDFRALAAQWYEQSRFMSSLTDIALLDPYQRIIGMGEKAVPLILLELQSQPDQWFWALEKIAPENPVTDELRGKVPEMAEAWLRWGRAKGYIR